MRRKHKHECFEPDVGVRVSDIESATAPTEPFRGLPNGDGC